MIDLDEEDLFVKSNWPKTQISEIAQLQKDGEPNSEYWQTKARINFCKPSKIVKSERQFQRQANYKKAIYAPAPNY